MPVRIDRVDGRFDSGEPGIERTDLRRSLERRVGRGEAPRPDLKRNALDPAGGPDRCSLN